MKFFATVVGLGVALFAPFLLLHEMTHFAVLAMLGGHPVLIERPWRLEFVALSLPSLHVAGAAALPAAGRVLFDLAGPGLPAMAAIVAARGVPWAAVKAALAANAGALVFFAVIEVADLLADPAGAGWDFLTWEEFNYGVPLLLILASAGVALTRLRSAR